MVFQFLSPANGSASRTIAQAASEDTDKQSRGAEEDPKTSANKNRRTQHFTDLANKVGSVGAALEKPVVLIDSKERDLQKVEEAVALLRKDFAGNLMDKMDATIVTTLYENPLRARIILNMRQPGRFKEVGKMRLAMQWSKEESYVDEDGIGADEDDYYRTIDGDVDSTTVLQVGPQG